MQLRELYTEGRKRLETAHIPEAAIEASILLSFATGLDKTSLHSEPTKKVDTSSITKFNDSVSRRINGEPYSYITGKKEFYSIDFIVNKDVLIPRPETELAVDTALKEIPDNGIYRVADLCSGSGCIGVALKLYKKNIKLIAADISQAAADVCLQNVRGNSLEEGSLVINTNYLDCISDNSLDMIVCNPPYVDEAEYNILQKEVRDFEPRQALLSDDNGFEHLKKVILLSKI